MIYLEKHNPAKNQKRFYSMEILPNLFGEFSLFKSWGRIGNKGQCRLEWYATKLEAEKVLQTVEKAKKRKGYSLEPLQLVMF